MLIWFLVTIVALVVATIVWMACTCRVVGSALDPAIGDDE